MNKTFSTLGGDSLQLTPITSSGSLHAEDKRQALSHVPMLSLMEFDDEYDAEGRNMLICPAPMTGKGLNALDFSMQ